MAETADIVAGVDFTQLRRAVDGACTLIDQLRTKRTELRGLIEECTEYLRALAAQCEACSGSGEVRHEDDAEPVTCGACEELWNLIGRCEAAQPQPAQIAGQFVDQQPDSAAVLIHHNKFGR